MTCRSSRQTLQTRYLLASHINVNIPQACDQKNCCVYWLEEDRSFGGISTAIKDGKCLSRLRKWDVWPVNANCGCLYRGMRSTKGVAKETEGGLPRAKAAKRMKCHPEGDIQKKVHCQYPIHCGPGIQE